MVKSLSWSIGKNALPNWVSVWGNCSGATHPKFSKDCQMAAKWQPNRLLTGNALNVDVSQLTAKIEDLMIKNLGVQFMKDIYSKHDYDVTELQGRILLNALKDSLTAKLTKVREILLDWKKVIEEDYVRTTAPIGDDRDLVLCCKYARGLKFNYQFERQVDMTGDCELTSFNKDVKSRAFRRLNYRNAKDFTVQAYKRLENKGLYIYYGQKDGYYLQFPGMDGGSQESCYNFDPRTRPWYVSAATQKTKDVVLLIDVSKNIDKALFKELVETFLKTLDPRDKVAVMPFAERLFLHPDHCFNSQLVSASPANRLAITTFAMKAIDDSSTLNTDHNIATYATAFQEAFKQFSNSSENEEKVIFLVTSGIYSDQEADKGKFVHVTNQAEMRNNIGTLYDFLTEDKDKVKVRYSFPYMDFFGTGVLIAVSVPTYKGTELQGVASIDLVVSELLSDVEYFKEGHNAYRFLIGRSGLVYQHPLLPKPVLAFEPTVPVDISLFERQSEFASVRTSMISGGSDSRAMLANRSVSRGDSSLEGATAVTTNYTYYWVTVPLTNFSLAVVIETSNANQYELRSVTNLTRPMVYHRLDRIGRPDTYKFCRFTKYLTLEESVVKLPADAFGSPAKYYVEETAKIVQDIMKYFSSNDKTPPNLLQSHSVARGLRKSVQITSDLDEFWKKSHSQYIVWRYIATENGVFKSYPGTELHPLYDPRSRPWYQRSLIYPDTTVISTPYFDDSVQSMIVTFSHLIQRDTGNSRETLAIMALDYSMNNLKNLVLNNVNECRNRASSHVCLLVDKSGLVVFHPDFETSYTKSKIEGQHITALAPGVASDLIKDKHLHMESCIGIYKTNKTSDIAEPHIQYFYMLDANRTVAKEPNALQQCPEYSLVPLPKTNSYLLIVRKRCLNTASCTCPKNGKCSIPLANFPCHCPCKHFLTCDEYLQQVSTTLVCPPPPFNLLLPIKTKEEEEKERKEAMTYSRCNDPKCKSVKTRTQCTAIGCQWCSFNSNGGAMPQGEQFCSYSDECPLGRKIFSKSTSGGKKSDTNILAIVLPIVLVIVFVSLVVAIVILYRKGRLPLKHGFKDRGVQERQNASYETSVEMNFSKQERNEVAL
eukprot:gene13661-4563_t